MREHNRQAPHQQKHPLLSQPAPSLPWSSVAADIFDWHGKHYLVLVDSYSNWFEMDFLPTISSEIVVQKLRQHFSLHGIPARLQTDNGTQFTSQMFKDFAKWWNFQRVTSSPEYPQSNGLAERAVRSAKQLMERSYLAKSDVYLDLLNLRNIARDNVLGSGFSSSAPDVPPNTTSAARHPGSFKAQSFQPRRSSKVRAVQSRRAETYLRQDQQTT